MVTKKKIKVSVGDAICVMGYKGDKMARPVIVDTIKPGGLMICKCLIRSSVSRPVFRSYKQEHIDGISRIKMD